MIVISGAVSTGTYPRERKKSFAVLAPVEGPRSPSDEQLSQHSGVSVRIRKKKCVHAYSTHSNCRRLPAFLPALRA